MGKNDYAALRWHTPLIRSRPVYMGRDTPLSTGRHRGRMFLLPLTGRLSAMNSVTESRTG
jgi:hypothetical protein